MEHHGTNQEILLITGSSFYSRQFCKRDESDTRDDLLSMEELERACWNGMLHEILPELVGNYFCTRRKFYLEYSKWCKLFVCQYQFFPGAARQKNFN